MRQVTGSNRPSSKFGVSIQQSLDGHSFSLPELERLPSSDEPVEVELLLPKAMLVPENLFHNERAAEFLAANGMSLAETECVVVCPARNGTVAVVALEMKIQQLIAEKFPQARFTSPLEHLPVETRRCIWICRRGELLYVKVYRDGVLQLAEVMTGSTEAEIGYFIQRLGAEFQLAEYELRIAGDESKKIRKWIGKAFEKVICE